MAQLQTRHDSPEPFNGTTGLARPTAQAEAHAAESAQRAFARALGDAASLLSRSGDYEQVLDGILETVAQIVSFETATIWLREGNALRVARARGFDRHGLSEWAQGLALPADTYNFRAVVEYNAPLVIPDVRNDPQWISFPQVDWIRGHMTAPIRMGGETVGMLTVDGSAPGQFTADDAVRLMAFADLAAAALHNAELLRETRQRAQEFQALYETTRDLAMVNETAPLLETIVERAMQLLAAPVGYLYIYDAPAHELVLGVCRGMELGLGYRMRLDEGVAGQVLRTRTPLFVNDYQSWSYRVWNRPSEAMQAVIAVPISYGGNLIGVLGLGDTAATRRFDENGLALLTLFAGQAAAALETARLLNETRQRAEQLALLYDVGLTLNRVLDAHTQLGFLFKIARRAVQSDRMAFFRCEPRLNQLRYESGVGLPRELEDRLRESLLEVSENSGLVGWVAQHRVPARIGDVDRDGRWVRLETLVRSSVAVPVEHDGELRGVLMASSEQPDAFSAQDERLLILFANQIAAAIELARLFQAQAQRQQELEILRQASLRFATAPDRARLIELILDYALQLIAADDAVLYLYEDDRLQFGNMLWAEGKQVPGKPWEPRVNGFTHTVARSGETIVIDQVNQHPLFATWQWGGAIVGLPLRGGGQVRAVLNVVYEQPHRFESHELRALGLLADQAAVALENLRNYDETQRQLRDAQLLHRAGAALNHTLSFEETVQQLADFFMEAVGVDVCTVSAIDTERDEIRVILDGDPSLETRVPAGTCFALSTHPHLIRLLTDKLSQTARRDDPDLPPTLAAVMDKYHWRSLLLMPLIAGKELIGLVELADSRQLRAFSANQVRLAESISHQAAGALRNARLYEEARRRAEELTLLNRIARGVSGARTVEELVEVIVRETLPLVPAESYYVALYDSATEEVQFRRFVDNGVPLTPFTWQLGPSLTREVISRGRALRIDERGDLFLPNNPAQFFGSGSANRSWLGVPMRSGNRIVGVLSWQSTRPGAYSEADEQLLQTIADQVAVAAERARELEG